MTPAFRYFLLWVVGSLLMIAGTLMMLQAAYADGQYVPAHPDAFYHARRILDAVMSGQPVAQFDSLIHVPEGSWISWPWAYDAAMAAITRLFGPFATEAAANRILMHIPVVAGPFAVALTICIGRLLRLSFRYEVVLVLAFSALPIMHFTYAVGNVDHHFAESLWTSMTLCAGMWFFRRPGEWLPAATLGVVLGTACGIHPSLFILQMPVLGVLLLRRVRGESMPAFRAVAVFAGTLLVATLAICLPSAPLRNAEFAFYALSWFQVYVAACTAVFAILLNSFGRKPAHVAMLALGALLALLPIVGGIDMAANFVRGNLAEIQGVGEIADPYTMLFEGTVTPPHLVYALWFAAPAMLFNFYLLLRERDAHIQFFALAGAFGLVLLQFQYRLHVFGEVALLATPLLAAQLASERWPRLANRVVLMVCAAFIIAFLPLRKHFTLGRPLAGYTGYAEFRSVFPLLRAACRQRPGIVLAGLDAGHWIRYHTACSVIGNVFLVTPGQAAKAHEARRLMNLTPASFLAENVPVTYVFAFHSLEIGAPGSEPDLAEFLPLMPRLEGALLGPLGELPPQFRLMWAATTPGGQPYARLFEIVRDPPVGNPLPVAK